MAMRRPRQPEVADGSVADATRPDGNGAHRAPGSPAAAAPGRGNGPAVFDGAPHFDDTRVAAPVSAASAAVASAAATETAIPVVPPPPPAPEFPSPTPSIPPPPQPPLVRRPGWGLDRPARRGERAPKGPRVVQGKRARRVLRRIDTWTVLKLSFLFYLCILLVVLIAGVVLWNIAAAVGAITSIEKFIKSLFDLNTFTFHPGVILEASAAGGIILVVMATGINVLAVVIYNLISDVVGGVQVIVLEEQEDSGVAGDGSGRRTRD